MKRNRSIAGWAPIWAGLSILWAAVNVLVAQSPWKGTMTKEGDVVIVKNPKEPLYKNPILSLKEDFVLGGANASGEYSFAEIRTAAVGDDGTVYVLDSREGHVKIFDQTGKYLKTFGRKGQGPGELDVPIYLSMNRAKGEIMVQEIGRRLSYFGLDGRFIRSISVKGTWALRARVDSKGRIIVEEGVLDPEDPRYVTKKFSSGMILIAELTKSPGPRPDVFNPFMAVNWWTIDANDNIVYGYPATYEIQILGAANTPIRKIYRDYDPVEITEEEKRAETKDYRGGSKLEFSKYHSAYRRFFLSDRGHIFVQTWEKTKDGKNIHDIFDAEGRFLSRIPLAIAGLEIRNGKYYALEEDAEGYQSLKRYSVEWKVK